MAFASPLIFTYASEHFTFITHGCYIFTSTQNISIWALRSVLTVSVSSEAQKLEKKLTLSSPQSECPLFSQQGMLSKLFPGGDCHGGWAGWLTYVLLLSPALQFPLFPCSNKPWTGNMPALACNSPRSSSSALKMHTPFSDWIRVCGT